MGQGPFDPGSFNFEGPLVHGPLGLGPFGFGPLVQGPLALYPLCCYLFENGQNSYLTVIVTVGTVIGCSAKTKFCQMAPKSTENH